MNDLAKKLAMVVGFLLLLAVFPMPYDYYIFLRLVVFVSGLFLAYIFYEQKVVEWAICLSGVALLFNPVFPIYLSREIWIPIDVVSAGLFFYTASNFKESS